MHRAKKKGRNNSVAKYLYRSITGLNDRTCVPAKKPQKVGPKIREYLTFQIEAHRHLPYRGQNSVHASLAAARSDQTLWLQSETLRPYITLCLLTINRGKAKSDGDWHALVRGRSHVNSYSIVKVRLGVCMTGAGMH